MREGVKRTQRPREKLYVHTLDAGEILRIADMLAGHKQGTAAYGGMNKKTRQAALADLFGVDPKDVARAEHMLNLAPRLRQELERGGISVSSAIGYSRFPAAFQPFLLAWTKGREINEWMAWTMLGENYRRRKGLTLGEACRNLGLPWPADKLNEHGEER